MADGDARIRVDCTDHELAELAYDAAYLVRLALAAAGRPVDTQELAGAIATAIVTTIGARDAESSKHGECCRAIAMARAMQRSQTRHDA